LSNSSPEELKSLVKRGYDECAPKYAGWQASRGVPQSISNHLTRLFNYLKPNASILELGCGPGIPYTQLLVDNELELSITAVDISASQISLAKEKINSSRVEFVHSDMTRLDYPEARFDAVVAFYSFFHIPKEEQGPMVKKITKWLKPGGVLLVNMNDKEGDVFMYRWLGVTTSMFSTGLGVEGNLKMFREFGEGKLDVEDTIEGESAGLSEEMFFHWFWAVKK
ncbi:Malonyl-[acyl-carrier protein] O-methyltransferase, partial [Leucoagaricus sp. SymC.cos]